MTKEQAKNIASILIARTAVCFDGTAFDDCNPMLSEKDQDKIIQEIEIISNSMVEKLEKKIKCKF